MSEDRPVARWTIAAATMLSATMATVLLIHEAMTGRSSSAARTYLQRALCSPFLAVPLWAFVIAAMFRLGRRRAPLVWGPVGLGALGLLVNGVTVAWGGPQHVLYPPAAALLGWLLGLLYARRVSQAREFDEAFAEAGALGCFAAVYLGAATSKLASGGLHWTNPAHLQGLLLSHLPIDASSALGTCALAVAHRPWLAGTLAVATLITQLGAILMVLSTRLRFVWATLILLFHLGVLLLLRIPYITAIVLALGLAYPWHALRNRVSQEEPTGATDERLGDG